MRGNRVFVLLAFAILLGLTASFLIWRYMQLVRPVAVRADDNSSKMTNVVAAAENLALGTLLSNENLKMVPIVSNSLPPGYFIDKQKVIGRGVVVPLVANEPVLESKVAPEGAGAGLPTVIPPGMRGVSVKVDEVIGVAGFVLPGTRVDVLVTVDELDETTAGLTKLVLQNVQVLAAGESIQKDEEGKPQKVTVITLLVTPEDAEKLTLAATEGKIQLALRNVLDQDSVVTSGSDVRALVTNVPRVTQQPVSAPPAPTVQTRARSRISVDLYRGVTKDVETF